MLLRARIRIISRVARFRRIREIQDIVLVGQVVRLEVARLRGGVGDSHVGGAITRSPAPANVRA